MPIVSALAIYLLLWFLVLFAVLPFGVRTAREEGAPIVPGQADSAPQRPRLARKFGWTTLIAAALFALFWLAYARGWLVGAGLD